MIHLFTYYPLQLLFRTLNQLLKKPHHNEDYKAAALRDALMPVRSWWLKHVPWAATQLKVCTLLILQDYVTADAVEKKVAAGTHILSAGNCSSERI